MPKERRGKSDKLIILKDLSVMMGFKPYYLKHHHYTKCPIGVMKIGKRLYVNKEFAKKIACQHAYRSSIALEKILLKIDNYKP